MESTDSEKAIEIYNTIHNVRFFENHVLNVESEFYYFFNIQEFTKYKNKSLLENSELKHRYRVLSVFNINVQSLMFKIIILYKLVIKYKKTNTPLHISHLQIRLDRELDYLNTSMIPTIRLNYDDNHLLGYKMNEYCISAFNMMFDNLENDYMIDIKNSPLFSTIENVYNKYSNLFDVEKMKVLSIPIHVNNQPQAVKTDEKYKTQNLFKVGLLFATGEMNRYFTINNLNEIVLNNGLSPLKIAMELGNPSFEKIILASKNDYKTGENKNKNIFNNLDMMSKIISDCEAKNVTVEPYFISRLPTE